jgi:hypothetical protein
MVGVNVYCIGLNEMLLRCGGGQGEHCIVIQSYKVEDDGNAYSL